MPSSLTGGQLIVEALRIHGADRVFTVPGESFLPVLDALHDAPELQLTVCRHEGGAAMMAEADGKLTGRPAVCLVTRGPGATNAASGLHVAMQDATPLLLLIGQVGRGMQEREAFQEIDYRRLFGPLAKWVTQIDDPARIPELLSRAFHTATAGRPGPVVLALPEDMLRERAAPVSVRPYRPVVPSPAAAAMDALRARLASARRPLVLAGGPGW
ncbi:MAG: thiamine pyrophosphate-binding protein, partial [Candidatus Competibacterales bacterium]|nr:thiamine pyrophosphate-binding protein [Candidatus Competibacterales bacterium]